MLHIFAAAPNGLMFFLGQMARGWGGVLCTSIASRTTIQMDTNRR